MAADRTPPISRLLPAPAAPTTLREAYEADRPTPLGRPWVNLCMIASLDGSVALAGRSGELGNANDRALLVTMRSMADVVIVGAATARGEGYGPPARRDLRIGVVTNSARIDPDAELFTSGAGFVITSASADVPSGIDVLRAGDDRVDLVDAIARLHEIVPGVGHVQAEGGPTLNGALADAGLVDELCFTLSPTIVGGDGPRMTNAAAEYRRDFRPAHVLVDADGYLFTRWLPRP
jgi:riboflavin biosynthesis pyrimidine reductase